MDKADLGNLPGTGEEMNMRQIGPLVRNFGRVRNSLSFLASVYGGDGVQVALGGLTEEEKTGLVRWAKDAKVVVEIGTLFGFTAKRLAAETQAKVVAVDNFSWNPFGMPAELHEHFTRLVLENELKNGRVELVKADAQTFLAAMKGVDFVFLDGDHRYEAVKAEIELVKKAGVKTIAGHDYGNALFGVTRAVEETLGKPDDVAGMVWVKLI